MENLTPTFSPQPVDKSKKKPLWIIAVVVVVLVLLAAFLLMRQSKKTSQIETTISPTQEPTPTEKPKIDKQTVKIQVLNGTGTPGQAAKAAEAMVKAGYNSDNIKTANSSNDNHATTTVAAKAGFEDVAKDIKESLGSEFDSVEINSTSLDKDNEFDVVVTTGGKKFETPTPKSEPTSSVTKTPTPTVSASPTPTSSPTPTP